MIMEQNSKLMVFSHISSMRKSYLMRKEVTWQKVDICPAYIRQKYKEIINVWNLYKKSMI